MSVKLSVTVVAYNNYADIKKAITSMESYTSSEFSKKIYIVDNGARNSEPAEVEDFLKFVRKHPEMEYIDTGKNLGFANGHNKVLPLLDSQYHVIMNADILFCEDAFTPILQYMDTNPDVGMVIPYMVDPQGKRQEAYRRELTVFDMFNRMFLHERFRKRAGRHNMREMDYTKPFRVPFGQGSFLVIRTELFRRLQGFDKDYFMYVEDADLCRRVNQVSKVMYFPDAKVIHKWEKGSHRDMKLFRYHVQSMIHYFRKWGWKLF